jgi:hypothetical protein
MAAGGQQQPGWPAEVAVQPRRRVATPVCETFVQPLAEVRRWFDRAAIGETMVYARGRTLLQGETSFFIRDKALAGLAHPWQVPLTDCIGFAFKVKKLADEAPASEAAAARPDPFIETIFASIARAAAEGRRCPSDAELAREAGLPTRAQAAWRVTKLRADGRIRSEPVTGHGEIGRVVTIAATGARTLAPKGWRAGGC